MAQPTDSNSNWLVSVLAIAVLVLALFWFFSGDDEAPSSPEMGAQLTREVSVPRSAPSQSGAGERSGAAVEGAGNFGGVTGEGSAGQLLEAPSGSVGDALPSGGEQRVVAAASATGDRGVIYEETYSEEPSPSEMERLLRDVGPLPTQAEIEQMKQSEDLREPTEAELDEMRAQMENVELPSEEELERMRRIAAIEPTEEELERLKRQAEQYEQSVNR